MHSAAGLGTLTAAGTGTGEKERGLGGSWQWEDAESCLQEKSAQPLTRYVSGCRAMQLHVLEGSPAGSCSWEGSGQRSRLWESCWMALRGEEFWQKPLGVP